jgi:hypothetical protein
VTALSTKPTFQTKRGDVLELQQAPFLLLLDIMDESNAPEPPIRLVPNSFNVREPDYEDEEYLKAKQIWESNRQVKMLRVCASFAILNEPSEDDPIVRTLRAIDNKMTPEVLKIRWIEVLVGDAEEMGQLIEEIISLSAPTEDGLEVAASEDRFRSVDKRKTRNRHPVKERSANGRLPEYAADPT